MEKISKQHLEKLVKEAEIMHAQRKFENLYQQELCMAITNLIKKSEYGQKYAESEFVLPSSVEDIGDIMRDSFDNAIAHYLKACSGLLGSYGDVSVAPFTRGLGTRSATAIFKPNKDNRGKSK